MQASPITIIAALALTAGTLGAQAIRPDSVISALARFAVGDEVRIASATNRVTGAVRRRAADSLVLWHSLGESAISAASIDTLWKGHHYGRRYAATGAKIGGVGLGAYAVLVLHGIGAGDETLIGGTILGTGVGALVGAMFGGAVGVTKMRWTVAFTR